VRWNAWVVDERYAELVKISGRDGAGDVLASRLDALARAGGLPATLRELGVAREDIPALAADAAGQWTGTFNPRSFDAAAARELYERAY
jgi:alcohol dehydrogenase